MFVLLPAYRQGKFTLAYVFRDKGGTIEVPLKLLRTIYCLDVGGVSEGSLIKLKTIEGPFKPLRTIYCHVVGRVSRGSVIGRCRESLGRLCI